MSLLCPFHSWVKAEVLFWLQGSSRSRITFLLCPYLCRALSFSLFTHWPTYVVCFMYNSHAPTLGLLRCLEGFPSANLQSYLLHLLQAFAHLTTILVAVGIWTPFLVLSILLPCSVFSFSHSTSYILIYCSNVEYSSSTRAEILPVYLLVGPKSFEHYLAQSSFQ